MYMAARPCSCWAGSLPHGVIEIPAILVGGQTGFVIAYALDRRWGSRVSRRRAILRLVSRDAVTLAGGLAVMLVWAGIVEAFLSQYHEPVIPYGMKIAFGLVEAALLTLFLSRAGAEQAGRVGKIELLKEPAAIRSSHPHSRRDRVCPTTRRSLSAACWPCCWTMAVIAALGTVLEKVLAPLKGFGEDLSTAVNVVLYFVDHAGSIASVAEWLWRGQTVGKRLLGLRVVDAHGLRLVASQVIVRKLRCVLSRRDLPARLSDRRPGWLLLAATVSAWEMVAAGTVVIRTAEISPRPDT